MREPHSIYNTHIKRVRGVISTDENYLHPISDKVDIRCTSEHDHETFSVTYKNIQILVGVKDVEKIIEEARNYKKEKYA